MTGVNPFQSSEQCQNKIMLFLLKRGMTLVCPSSICWTAGGICAWDSPAIIIYIDTCCLPAKTNGSCHLQYHKGLMTHSKVYLDSGTFPYFLDGILRLLHMNLLILSLHILK